jgi:hypothetical protein
VKKRIKLQDHAKAKPSTSPNVNDVAAPSHLPSGKFAPGNRLGKGNPHARRVAEWRAALFQEVTHDEMRAVIRRLLRMAKAGDVAAIKLLLDRTLGRVQEDVLKLMFEHARTIYAQPDEKFL